MTNVDRTDPPMTKSAKMERPEPWPEPPAEKKRRRFTPEERIANRKADIARIEEKQREKVREQIGEAAGLLLACAMAAELAGMKDEAKRCDGALIALNGQTVKAKES